MWGKVILFAESDDHSDCLFVSGFFGLFSHSNRNFLEFEIKQKWLDVNQHYSLILASKK